MNKQPSGSSGWIDKKLISQSTRTGAANEQDARMGWECAKCGLIMGGAPLKERPERCPVCISREGKVVAVLPTEQARLSMMVLDRRLLELIQTYRRAKEEHERASAAQALIHQLGNYEMDDSGISSDIEASASREQRSALALADATEERARKSRTSRPSMPSIH